MFTNIAKRTFIAATLFGSSLTASGCLNDVVTPLTAERTTTVTTPDRSGLLPAPLSTCPYANPDLVADGWIDSSDLVRFAQAKKFQDPAGDFNGDGVVEKKDQEIIQALMGRAYTFSCENVLWILPAGCHPYASPDITGDGWVDSSDLVAFSSAQKVGDLAKADFNGDGRIDTLDQIILEDHVGKAYTEEPCGARTACPYANPDMVPNGWIDSSDLVAFASAKASGNLAGDFTGDRAVNDQDQAVLEALYGRAYTFSCDNILWALTSNCHPYASPDITGDGWVDSSDLVAFSSAQAAGDLAKADFNGDRLIDKLDQMILQAYFGKAYTVPPCSIP